MGELFYQLGIDWRLLLSQGLNFFILLIALTFLVFKPLMRIVEERRKKIETGLRVGEEAERRLAAIDKEKAERMAQAEKDALELIKKGEVAAKAGSAEIISAANKKAGLIAREAQDIAERRKEELDTRLGAEAKNLVRQAIAKTVDLRPEAIDEALISEALKEIKKARI